MGTVKKRHSRSAIFRLGVLSLLALGSAPAVGQTIVWTDTNAKKIQARNINGGPVQDIAQFPAGQAATLIDYDPVEKKFYYLAGGASAFHRCNLDGSNPEDIPTPTWGGFTLNVEFRKLYWRNNIATVYRSNLDGSEFESHAYSTDCCIISLLSFGNNLFFGSTGTLPNGIWRADADLSNEQLINQNASDPQDLAYDPVEKTIYVAEIDGVFRMNLDGTGYQAVVSGNTVHHLAVDSRSRKLYWIDGSNEVIWRSNLDGSNVETFLDANQAGNQKLNLGGLTIVDSPNIPTMSQSGFAVVFLGLAIAGTILSKGRIRAPGL
jgi:hypothetical protein